MSPLLWEITRWEFQRWFKWKGTLVILALSLASALMFSGVSRFLSGANATPVLAPPTAWTMPVLQLGTLKSSRYRDERLHLMPSPTGDEERTMSQLRSGELHAALILRSDTEAEFWVSPTMPDFPHLDHLRSVLQSQRWAQDAIARGASEEELAALAAPFQLKLREVELDNPPADDNTQSTSTAAALIVNIIMLLGVYVGLAVQFQAITAEKAQRVTEQVLACIRPQTWIDGKILGLSLLSATTTLTYVIAFLIFVLTANAFGSWFEIPAWALEFQTVAPMCLSALGGYLLWVTFFAGVAATVSDPNTSARGGLMMLPMLPFGLAMVAFQNPDLVWIRLLSFFPPTATPILCTRLVLTEVPWWEVAGSLVSLGLGVLLLRRAAGKIFGLAVLMHGKEPSWREVLHWIRRA